MSGGVTHDSGDVWSVPRDAAAQPEVVEILSRSFCALNRELCWRLPLPQPDAVPVQCAPQLRVKMSIVPF